MNSALTNFGLGPNQGDNSPSAFLNYILFDENYKVMDMGWTAVPETANFAKQKLTIPTVTAKEAGYIFVYLSYEGLSNTYVYFDDFKVTFTPTNILQSNEYYPFGMQAATSWTRDNAVGNNYLANGGTELNNTTGLYDLEFRNYDPILGRLNQVDPFASKYSSISPYNFAFNDPAYWNDPSGADVLWGLYTREQYESATTRREGSYNRGEYGGDYSPEAMAEKFTGAGTWYKQTTTYLNTFNCPTCPNGKRYELSQEVEYFYDEQMQGSDLFGQALDIFPSRPFTGSNADGQTYFEGVKVHGSSLPVGSNRFSLPSGIHVDPNSMYDVALLQHEFGHILFYRKFGALAFVNMGLESMKSVNEGHHEENWTEWTANVLSWQYFNYPSDWDETNYPLGPSPMNPSYPPVSVWDFYR